MFAIGFVIGMTTLVYVLKDRRDKWAPIKSLAGGTISAGALAALSTKIAGIRTVDLTWMEAVVLSGGGVLSGIVFMGVTAAIYFHVLILRPIQSRYGRAESARIRVAFWSGTIALRQLLSMTIDQKSSDEAWDEFCIALIEVVNKFSVDGANSSDSELMAKMIDKGLVDEKARELLTVNALDKLFKPPIERLSARLNHTRLNFSVWRIDADEPRLEHLMSFPSEVQHAHKDPLPIWKDSRTQADCASVGARSILEHAFVANTTEEAQSQKYNLRGMGLRYDEVAGIPLAPSGDRGSAWGVICVEKRGGVIPLKSETVKMILGRLAEVLGPSERILKRRTLKELRDTLNADAA